MGAEFVVRDIPELEARPRLAIAIKNRKVLHEQRGEE